MIHRASHKIAGIFRRCGRRHLQFHIAIGVIFALTVATGLWVSQAARTHLADAAADAALAGRQEMLVQRIARKAAQLVRAPTPETETVLANAVTSFDLNTRYLAARATETSRLTLVFFESGELSLNVLSRRYLDAAREVLDDPGHASPTALHDIGVLAEAALMVQQAEATAAFDDRAAALVTHYAHFQTNVLAMLAALLAAEAGLVARPLRGALARAGDMARRDDAEIARLCDSLSRTRADCTRLTGQLVEAGWMDELTGLMNRGHFRIHLEAEVQRAEADNPPLGVVAVSLDNFRVINEGLGHSAGDALLRGVAERLRAASPEGAALARIDGNGFAVAAPFSDGAALIEAAKSLVSALEEPVRLETRDLRLSVSLGVALRANGQPAERLLSDAEIALGQVRHAGPGGVLAFAPRMRAELEARETLIEELRDAVRDRNFCAYFQPQVGLGGSGLLGFEVLARWPHPVRGLMTPDQFLPAAREAGLVGAVDMIVLMDALETLVRLRAEGLNVPRISFNASVERLMAEANATEFAGMIDGAGLTAGDLVIELSEARLRMIGETAAMDILDQLRWAGFAVEIDRFGTGFASLATLSRLQVDGVKLDRALVASLPDPGSESVLRALVGLARELGLRVIAEGVQTSTSLDFLSSIGVHAVQGFGIARPMPERDLRSWMGADFEATSAA